MEILYDLTHQNLKNRRVLDSLLPSKSDGPLLKLYSILLSDIKLNDHEAMEHIYGRRCTTTFSMLKNRMKDILIRAVISQVSKAEVKEIRRHALLNSERTFIGYRLILFNGNTNLAIKILESELKNSIKFQFTEEILRQIRSLVLHYGTSNYNKYKLQKYVALHNKYLRILQFEIKAMHYYLDLQKVQMQSLANLSEEIRLKAAHFAKELIRIQDVESLMFNYYRFRVLTTHYEFESDYTSLLSLCNQTEEEFNEEIFWNKSNLTNIALLKAFALIQLGKYDECISLGRKKMKDNTPGSNLWYILGYYTLKALLYENKFKHAVNLISLMVNHLGYKKLSEGHKELIFVNLGYIHLIVGSGIHTDAKKLKDQLPEFRIAKFLNTARVFNKDKRGINVSILLLEIAFLLQRKKYDAIIDRLESLQKYTYRYLRKDDTFRSNCIIKLVIQMAKSDFHPVRTRRLTQDLHKKLTDVKLQGSGSNIDIEVIPFEVLWDIMLKAL